MSRKIRDLGPLGTHKTSDDAADRIWEPFFTTKAKGIGLGLSVCKRIVEAHKGYISFKTEVGKGTTFTLTFPTQAKKDD